MQSLVIPFFCSFESKYDQILGATAADVDVDVTMLGNHGIIEVDTAEYGHIADPHNARLNVNVSRPGCTRLSQHYDVTTLNERHVPPYGSSLSIFY
jgi:hypothetical protein